ncbi:MAG: SBBP repeat-containing protein [Planctomycetota bacterium]|nr:SBBP repeat-containing protein [Planctomycetota bacterium]
MSVTRFAVAVLALPTVLAWLGGSSGSSPQPGSGLASAARVAAGAPALADAPRLAFVANDGAWDERVAFVALGGPTVSWIGEDGLTLRLERRDGPTDRDAAGAVVRFGFGAPRDFVGEGAAPHPVHVLRAGGASARTAAQVRARGCWDGIDVVFRDDPETGADGTLAYDLHLAPGADLAAARVVVEGASVGAEQPDGGLAFEVELAGGSRVTLVQRAPVSFVESASGRRPVRSALRRIDRRTFGFEVEDWDGTDRLVVDPGFTWSTYLGGGASDACHALVVAPDGDIVLGGWAGSTDFPTTPGAYRSQGTLDAFVARLAPDGATLRYATYLGGGDVDEVLALDLAPDGAVVCGGWTASLDFPTTAGVLQPTFGFGSTFYGFGDGFVAELAPDGSALRWATYLGPQGDDFVKGLVRLDDGSILVAGETNAEQFPTTPGAFQPGFGSGSILVPDLFLARLAPGARAIEWATYFGEFAQELFGGLAVAPDGGIVLAGLSASFALPTTEGAFQREMRGSWDGFVTRFNADGTALDFSTYIGGDGYDQVRSITVDEHGEIYLAGRTAFETGVPFPVTSAAFQAEFGTEEDGFVARLSADGRRLVASTVLGGDGDDSCETIALGADGGILVGGFTSGRGFPVPPGTAQSTYGGGIHDGFVMQFDPTLSVLRGASYVGGSAKDQVVAVAASPQGVIVAGTTFSSDVPTTAGALQPSFGGASDGFVASVPFAPSAATAVQLTLAAAQSPVPAGTAGAWTMLGGALRNDRAEAVHVEAVELFVADAGSLTTVAVHEDVDGDGRYTAGEPALSVDVPIPADGERCLIPLSVRVPSGTELSFVVVGRGGLALTDGTEALAGATDLEGFVVRSETDGRRVTVLGASGTLQGDTLVFGARRSFTGDYDSDGAATCRDVRMLATRIGQAPRDPDEDPDGDGQITDRDVDLLLSRVLEQRPAYAASNRTVRPGGSIRIDGFGLDQGVVDARLDGVGVRIALRDARMLVIEVPRGLALGSHRLQLLFDDVMTLDVDVLVEAAR